MTHYGNFGLNPGHISLEHRMIYFAVAAALVLMVSFCICYWNFCCCDDDRRFQTRNIIYRLPSRSVHNNNYSHSTRTVYTNHLYSAANAPGLEMLGWRSEDCPPPPYESVVVTSSKQSQSHSYGTLHGK